jgi:hypothetical protein
MVITKAKKWTIIGIAILVSLFILFFSARTFILSKVIDKAKIGLHNKLNVDFKIESYGFKFFRSIYFTQITLTDSLQQQIFHADSVFFQLKVLPLFVGKIRFNKFYSNNLSANLNNKFLDKILQSRNRNTKIDSVKTINYAQTFNNIFKVMFSLVPNEVKMDSSSFHYQREKMKLTASCAHFQIIDNTFSGNLILSDTLNKSDLHLSGFIDANSQKFNISCNSNNNQPVTLPYINTRWGLSIKFDTLNYSFNLLDDSWDRIKFAGLAQVSNFEIQNKRISPTPVIIKSGYLDFIFNAGERFIELDSASVVSANSFSFSPYMKFENLDGIKLTIQIPRKEFDAADLFESIPEGLFNNIRGMKVSGKLAYMLNFEVNFNLPDSLKFSSQLENIGFKILHYGSANLQMLNDTFVHTAYESDQTAHSILVSPENSSFTSLENISDSLKLSVLTSEDGDFYYHKGFNEEAFKNSIITNIKEKRFARGGSTITMQLIKNIYLTRNKTITRKLEEAFIVWMIENLHLVSKERMFEVYLNIIEWGPGIYGIKDASEFYFKKKPSELTLVESIFLASIIPSPKYFKYAFKPNGELTNYYSWFYDRLPDVMVRLKQIQPSDTIGLKPTIKLCGRAKELLSKPDSILVDSIFINNPELLIEKLNEDVEK